MKVDFKKQFTYFHDGFRRVDYGPGIADVSEEVAKAAEAIGALDGTEMKEAEVEQVVEEPVKETKQYRTRK